MSYTILGDDFMRVPLGRSVSLTTVNTTLLCLAMRYGKCLNNPVHYQGVQPGVSRVPDWRAVKST